MTEKDMFRRGLANTELVRNIRDETAMNFLNFALECGAIQFGAFELKSGRMSPYFFNTGVFYTGESLGRLGEYYATCIEHSNIKFDMIFGPAYKGIPIATATSIGFSKKYEKVIPWCFNRKELKDHGDGGWLVGAPLKGKVVVVEDVITRGTTLLETRAIIENSGAVCAGVFLAFDREERSKDVGRLALSAMGEKYNIPIKSIARFGDLVAGLKDGTLAGNMRNEDRHNIVWMLSDYRKKNCLYEL